MVFDILQPTRIATFWTFDHFGKMWFLHTSTTQERHNFDHFDKNLIPAHLDHPEMPRFSLFWLILVPGTSQSPKNVKLLALWVKFDSWGTLSDQEHHNFDHYDKLWFLRASVTK